MNANNLISLQLPVDLTPNQISETLQIPLKKGIESTHFAELAGQRYLFFTLFDVITFINWKRDDIVACLQTLNIANASHYETHLLLQDYQIKQADNDSFHVGHNYIALPELSLWPLMVVSLVVSQSVGLEKFELSVDTFFTKGRDLIHQPSSFGWRKRQQFSDYAKQIMLLQHDMVLDLMLLDKPNVLWDNPEYEALYNKLALSLDIQQRFDVVSYKLNTLKEDIAMMMDLFNHKHSSFLEWIVIILILIEVVMSLWGFLKPVAASLH